MPPLWRAPAWPRSPHRPGRLVGDRALGLALDSPGPDLSEDSHDESLPVVRLIVQRDAMDCGVVTLAMYLGRSYEDVFAAAVLANRQPPHQIGMDIAEMQRTAKRLGVRLRRRRRFDLDEACGILGVAKIEPRSSADPEHVVLLKAGLIWDTDALVWDPETYFVRYRYRPITLLVRI